MIKHRVIIAVGLTVLLTLTGLGAANALWNSVSTAGGSITAGTIGVTQTGFSSLAVIYTNTAPVVTSDTAPVTVKNTGSVTTTYSLALAAPSGNAISSAANVRTWPVAATGDCTAAASVGSGATSSLWTAIPVLTGTLLAAGSAIYCVRTSMTTAQINAASNVSMIPTLALTVTATVGTWTASTSATTTQAAAKSTGDTVAPSAPGSLAASDTSGYSTTLRWNAATDNVAVTAYDVYRGTTLIASGATSPYTDVTLAPATAYSYTVKARDAAGNTSAASNAVNVTTLAIDSSFWYRLAVDSNTSFCVDSYGAGQTNGNAVGLYGCSTAINQQWQFVKTTNGNYNIVAHYGTSLGLGFTTTGSTRGLADRDLLQLWKVTDTVSTQWSVDVLSATAFGFTNLNSGKCIDINANNVSNVQLEQWSCNQGSAQSFRLIKMG